MLSFHLSDYLFTPRDIAQGLRYLYVHEKAHHFVDVLALVALVAGMRLVDLGGASVLALLFLTWKFAIPRFRSADALDLLTLALCLWLIHYLWNASEEALFFFAFAAVLFRWRVDGRVAVGAALACLAAIPASLVLFQLKWWWGGERWAETIAVWAYYFLAIGVGKQIFELAMARREERI